MIHKKYIIIGAGIGGLSTAAELKSKGENDFLILERTMGVPRNMNNGSHFLHAVDFGTPFPFEFKKTPITEEIWNTRTNTFTRQATLPEVIEYSKKIMENKRHITYITKIGEQKEVWVPENNDMNSLNDAYADYIGAEHFVFGETVSSIDTENKIVVTKRYNPISVIDVGETYSYDHLITTAPLDKFYELCGMKCPYELKHKELYVTNFKNENIVPNWMIILYMSDPKFPPFRISAMNGNLSMESMQPLTYEDDVIVKYTIGELFDYDLKTKEAYTWTTGRIFGLDHHMRGEIIESFNKLGIQLVGRFANWDGKLNIHTTIKQAKEIIRKITEITSYGQASYSITADDSVSHS